MDVLYTRHLAKRRRRKKKAQHSTARRGQNQSAVEGRSSDNRNRWQIQKRDTKQTHFDRKRNQPANHHTSKRVGVW
jgi:hypothetical protein